MPDQAARKGTPGLRQPGARAGHQHHRQMQTQDNNKRQHNTMKTILTLIAAASVAATSAFAAEKCANCAECCKAATKTCTKDCCKAK